MQAGDRTLNSYTTDRGGHRWRILASKINPEEIEETEIEENQNYYDGYTQDYWIGAEGDETKEEGQKFNDATARLFQSDNIIGECLNRHLKALLHKSPIFKIVNREKIPDNIEQDAVNYIASLLQRTRQIVTGDRNQFPDPFYECILTAMIGGVGYLRVTNLDEYDNPLQKIAIHSPDRDSVEVSKRNAIGIPIEIRYRFVEDKKEIIEVQSLAKGLTAFRYEDDKGEEISDRPPFAIDLGGNLSIQEYRRAPYINYSMKTAQNALNHASTLIPRNNELSGSSNKTYLNAQPPGKLEMTPQGQKVYNIDKEGFVNAPGIVTFVSGIPIVDTSTGQKQFKGYTTPQVHVDKPVEIRTFVEAARYHAAIIYAQAGQGHMMSNDLSISGRSRIELRNDFYIQLQQDATHYESILNPLFQVALMMYGVLTGQSFKDLEISFELIIFIGSPSTEERSQIIQAYNAGLMSRRTAIALLGYVDDADGELEAIEKEKASKPEQTGTIDLPS